MDDEHDHDHDHEVSLGLARGMSIALITDRESRLSVASVQSEQQTSVSHNRKTRDDRWIYTEIVRSVDLIRER